MTARNGRSNGHVNAPEATGEPDDNEADEDEPGDEGDDEPAAEEPEEERPARRRPRRSEEADERPRARRRISPARVIRAAREQVEELTGRRVTGVIGFDRTDGGWDVRVEVLELSRVPATMSILGLVLVQLDEDGELVGYRRLRRYSASQVDEG